MRLSAALALVAALAGCGRTPGITALTPPLPDGTQPTPPQMTTTQPLVGCTGKTVVALDRATLERLGADGSTQVLFHFGDGLPDDDVIINDWQQAGGFIGAVAFLDDEQGTTGIRYEYVVLDAQGNTVFHRIQGEPYNSTIHLSADGTLAVAGGTGWLVRNGVVTDLGPTMPTAAMLPDGRLPVAKGQPWDPASPKGLLELGSMRFTALSPMPDASSMLFELAGGLGYTTGNTLVVISSTGTQQLTLPASDSDWAFASTAGDRFVLLQSDGQYVVADLMAQHVFPIAGTPDPSVNHGNWTPTVGADGTVFAGFLENSLLQLRQSTDHGATWQTVGDPMAPGQTFGLGQSLNSLAHGGSVLIINLSFGYGAYLNAVQLVSGTTRHEIDTGAMYLNAQLDPGATDLSADGQCAAVWAPTGVAPADGQPTPLVLTFIDAQHGATKAQTSDHPAWFRF